MTDSTPTVGVVGDDRDAVASLATERGLDATTGGPVEVLEAAPDVVVALGEAALYDLVRAGTSGPLLAVDAGGVVGDVPRESVPAALSSIEAGEFDAIDLPTIGAAVGGERYRALADAMLVTARAARISEYGIYASASGDRRETVDVVRADGVLASTPAGGAGYADAVDAPRLGAGVDGVAVTPIAPFRIERTNWVLSLPVTLTVERDENPVTLLVDDDDVGVVDPGAAVTIDREAPLSIVETPQSRSLFD